MLKAVNDGALVGWAETIHVIPFLDISLVAAPKFCLTLYGGHFLAEGRHLWELLSAGCVFTIPELTGNGIILHGDFELFRSARLEISNAAFAIFPEGARVPRLSSMVAKSAQLLKSLQA